MESKTCVGELRKELGSSHIALGKSENELWKAKLALGNLEKELDSSQIALGNSENELWKSNLALVNSEKELGSLFQNEVYVTIQIVAMIITA